MPRTNRVKQGQDTETRIREAMARLLEGRAQYCDGKLTKINLSREAGVSQATLFRAKEILEVWNDEVSRRGGKTLEAAQLISENELLKTRCAGLEKKNADLRKELTAAATVIAELHARTDQSGGIVIDLQRHGRKVTDEK